MALLTEEKAKQNIQRFSRRLLELMYEAGIPTERDMAEKLGIHPNTLTRYKKGDTAPDLKVITKICDDFDVPVGWLLGEHDIPIAAERTMEQNERSGPSTPKVNVIDVDLVDALRYLASDVYREVGQRLPPNQATREAAVLYNLLLEKVSDIADVEEVKAAFPQIRYILKKRLNQAAANPGTGKRSAS